VAVLGTTYSLFYYLLLTGEEGLRHTYFVLTDGIPSPLRDKLPHQFVHNHYGVSKPIEALYRLADYLRLRLAHRLHHLQGLPIYGHDHLPASYYYTHCRREPFYVVEDGTHNYIPDRIHLTRALPPGSLLIKPHPREHTDYRLHFPQATVLGGLFPVEVLLILYADRVADVYSVDSSCMAFIRKHLTQPVWEIRCLPHPSEILGADRK
jgi:hypothetical protein